MAATSVLSANLKKIIFLKQHCLQWKLGIRQVVLYHIPRKRFRVDIGKQRLSRNVLLANENDEKYSLELVGGFNQT